MAKASVSLHCTQCETEYTMTKTCHNRTEADSWESYMEGRDGLCTECWKKAQQLKREAEQAQLVEKVNTKLNEAGIVLPELTGSENQIAWAKAIRYKVIEQLTKMGFKWDAITNRTYQESIAAEVAKLFETSAKVWIDSRGKKIFTVYVE